MKKYKAAFIGGRGFSSNYGGVENATREISLALSNRDIKLLVYGVQSDCRADMPANITQVSCPLSIYKKLGQHAMILYCTLHAMFIARPQVVFLFASGPCIFTPLLRIAGIKVITSLRAIDSARDKWGIISKNILKAGEYCAWRFSNVFTVNSLEMFKHYENKRSDVLFIPNGSKLDVSSKAIPNQLFGKSFFLFAARLDPVKRLHLLLEAYEQLDIEGKPLLVIAGGHSKDSDYEKQLRAYESDNVIFLGHLSQEELAPLMSNCKAFVLPSVLEGMSNSILSAMINGRPVLAANIPANSDLLAHQQATFKADDISELSKALSQLATNDEFCALLGESLKRRAVEHFTWQATADKFYHSAARVLN